MTRINIRAKGASGEREIADMLAFIIYTCMKQCGYTEDEALKAFGSVQRNQNQSAVGGNDLSNTFGLSIEVKRQEQLAIPSWWRQCEAAAARNQEVPVLVYRQNRKAWRVVTYAWLGLPGNGGQQQALVEFDIETFKVWFANWVARKLQAGETLRT